MRSKKALLNIVTNLVLQIFIFLYGFILPKIIMSKYGSNVNGLISSVSQFLAYISLLESGVGPVVKSILFEPIAKKDNKKIIDILYATEKFFRRIAMIFIVYIFVLIIFYPMIIDTTMNKTYVSSLIIIISISIFSQYFFGMVYSLFLQANQESYVISLIQVVTYILSITAALVMAKLEVSVHTLKLCISLLFVLRPIMQNVYVKKRYNLNLTLANKDYVIKNRWDGLAQHIAYVVHSNTDITVLSLFSTLSEVSVYSVYLLIVKGIKALISAFTSGLDASFGDMISRNEIDNLRNKFELYEIIYFIICSVLFSCLIILIVPFVQVYTYNINDADYIRPIFGVLLAISECIWAIRLPYLTLTYAAGHFKETRTGAWIECILNLLISIILVRRLGIVGVTIGTIVAMIIRTAEFIYHANYNILKVNILKSVKKVFLLIFIICITSVSAFKIFNLDVSTYYNWIKIAVFVFIYSTATTLLLSIPIYRKNLKRILNVCISLFKRKLK